MKKVETNKINDDFICSTSIFFGTKTKDIFSNFTKIKIEIIPLNKPEKEFSNGI